MTHEQKPESAEFRTREAQKAALAEALEDGMSRSAAAEEAERHIAEVEARGAAETKKRVYDALNTYPIGIRIGVTRAIMVASDAIDKKEIRFGNLDKLDEDRVDELTREVEQLKAEQRRKDAERADLLGYVTQTGEDGLRHPYAADAFMRGVLNRKMDKFNTPVYTRPANVAALEDRVKELEGALGVLLNWADGQWCPHENTHRGGSIWTICNDCGRKWADDVKPFDPDEDFEPSAIKQAYAAIREGGEHG